MELKNAVAIVTGSATGIGAASAIEFAKHGCRTVINYSRSEAEAMRTMAEVEQLGVEALLIKADVSDDADCRRMVDATLAKWGRVDALVNNAGITSAGSGNPGLEALNAEDFQRVFAVNVVGAYQMIRAVVPAMQAQGAGSVVNVSSTAAITGLSTSIAYAASKGALNTMTLSLARALGPEIRVNGVCPGFVETRWLQGLLASRFETGRAQYAANAPLKKTVTPADVASAIVWLTAGADLVTGEFIIIDGGTHLAGASAKAR